METSLVFFMEIFACRIADALILERLKLSSKRKFAKETLKWNAEANTGSMGKPKYLLKRLIKQLTVLLRSSKSSRRRRPRHKNAKQVSEHMANATTCSSAPHCDWNGICCSCNSSCDVCFGTLSQRNQAPAPQALPLRSQMDFTCTERPLLLHLVSSSADSGLCSDMEDELEQSAVSSCCSYSGDEDDCVWDLEEFEDAAFSPLLEEWLITASDLSLDKVISATERETVYRCVAVVFLATDFCCWNNGLWHACLVQEPREGTVTL